jgi:hypothetical protein
MADSKTRAETFTRNAIEALNVYADTNLKILRGVMDFSANLAKESVSLYAELQSHNIEVLQEGQSAVLRRLSELPEAAKDPASFYQKNLQEFAASGEKIFKLLQSNAQALMRSGEHYWIMSQQTGTKVQESCNELAEKLKALYTTA